MVERYNLEICFDGERFYRVRVVPREMLGSLQGFGSFIQRVLKGGVVGEIVDQLGKIVCEYYEFSLTFVNGARENLGEDSVERLERVLGG
ncbi:MAG: hypothetical protein ABII03_04945 [Nanoarchaeota archaeon]